MKLFFDFLGGGEGSDNTTVNVFSADNGGPWVGDLIPLAENQWVHFVR